MIGPFCACLISVFLFSYLAMFTCSKYLELNVYFVLFSVPYGAKMCCLLFRTWLAPLGRILRSL